MISPVIFFNLITGLIGAFQYFTEVHVMTGGTGSPADSTIDDVDLSLPIGLPIFQNRLCLGPGLGALFDRDHLRCFLPHLGAIGLLWREINPS